MTTASLPLRMPDRDFLWRVVTAGLVVGVLDMTAATVSVSIRLHQFAFTRVWQGVASALLGPDASKGGVAAVALGLAMHFTIAMSWTIVFALLYRNLEWLRMATRSSAGATLTGAVYGPLIWMAMSLVIVPMTRAVRGPPFTAGWFIQLGIHVLCVGMPIAWIVRDAAR